MRFGVNILNFGKGTEPATLLRWARYAEEQGFDFAMISDHLALTPKVAETYPAPFYDPFTTLAWLAGRTSRIELGTSVALLPFRHPLHTARTAANIDQFSDGRLILGVGVSWDEREYAALGVDYERRGAVANEYLDVITRAWESETLTFHGEFVSFDDVSMGPLPVRTPPVWVGGASGAAMRRAARYGEAWHPLNKPVAWYREEGLPALRKAAAEADQPVPAFAPRVPLLLTDTVLDGQERPAGHGTLDQVRRDIDELAELGATYLLFDTYQGTPEAMRPQRDDERMLEAVARHVLGEDG